MDYNMNEPKFNVTHIEFDFDDDEANTVCNSDLDTFFIASEVDRKEVTERHLGVWEDIEDEDKIMISLNNDEESKKLQNNFLLYLSNQTTDILRGFEIFLQDGYEYREHLRMKYCYLLIQFS